MRLIVSLLVLLLCSTAIADVTTTIVPGDRVLADLAGGETDSFGFLVGQPSSLTVTVATKSGLEAGLRVIGPDGLEVDLGTALGRSPGRRPRVRAAQLRTAGTYAVVVEHAAGKGEYRLRLKLTKSKSRQLDLRDSPASAQPPIALRAADVGLESTGTSLQATTVQDALAELSALTDTAGASIADHDNRIPVLESATTALQTTSTDHQDRITALEFGTPGVPNALRVLSSLDTTENVQAEAFMLPNDDDAYRVKRHKIATLTFGAGEIESAIVAHVRFTYRAVFQSGTSPRRDSPVSFLVWSEVGSKELVFLIHRTPQDPASIDTKELGLSDPPAFTPPTFSYMLVYEPTPSERADGFTFDVLISAIGLRAAPYNLDGFSIDIDSAVILGR